MESMVMKNYFVFWTALIAVALFTGCDRNVRMGKGFVFPEGDAGRGKQAFTDLECYNCHRVEGVFDLPAPTASPEKVLVLGGKVAQLRTYGDLVTAIIHPKYELSDKWPGRANAGESPMRVSNETMTVTQLLDIVTFLHPKYQELEQLYSYRAQ